MTVRIHHVQVAIPVGGEDKARSFWADVLGFHEIAKPPALAKRGGAWFRGGEVEIHCGVEDPFAPARKAHPGLEVDDLEWLSARLIKAGYSVEPDDSFPGYLRFYSSDPFGNRLEFLAADSTE